MADVNDTRRSPVHDLLEAHQAQWSSVGGAPIARRVHDPQVEAGCLATVALCDRSALSKLGLKGAGVAAWLANQGVTVPAAIYDTARLGDGGVVSRVGADEFFLEDGVAGGGVTHLRDRLDEADRRAWRVERQDAGFLLAGPKAPAVLAQTCGVDVAREAPDRLFMTRVAGVSCSIRPQANGDAREYCLWLDPSYAVYLWEQLAQIATELGGGIVGVDCIAPGMLE